MRGTFVLEFCSSETIGTRFENMEENDEETLTNKPVRGIAKSGRIWKTQSEKRFSKIKKDAAFKSNWEKKKALKLQRDVIKSMSQEIRTEKKRIWDEKLAKSAEKKKRKLENERKSEIVQVVS